MEVEVVRTKITLACTLSVRIVITTRQRTRKLIQTEWKPRSIVDSARLIHYTRKPNRLLGKGVRKWEKPRTKLLRKRAF